jgi:hypothetical protein
MRRNRPIRDKIALGGDMKSKLWCLAALVVTVLIGSTIYGCGGKQSSNGTIQAEIVGALK